MAKEKNYKLNKADKQKSGLIIFSNFDPKPKNEETEEQTEQLVTEIEKVTKPAKEKKSKKAKKAKASTVENLDTNLNP